ncbi:TWiK family of potassium channels protein 18-like protein [Dinothrombium tinctorium]|uniref:TWiK family of potassium channels protein 18-like protein n=1 Tax=Dinothrombium tinctorium TaxID=1965070 RepID=A0A3S3P0G2_9ACAR|nr:TWiK family of potassium channels protein 18-like protein [Dinothrombium tinctorium]
MPAARQRSRIARYRYYCRVLVTFLFSHIGLCLIVAVYSSGGAALFQFLEYEHESEVRRQVQIARENYTEQLWNITLDLEVLRKENWTDKASVVLDSYEEYLYNVTTEQGFNGKEVSKWDFMGALIYSIIVITTIGYGDRVPLTFYGKLVTVLYAIAGIPLMLLFLSNIGDVMANSFKFIYWKCSGKRKEKKPRRRRRRTTRRGVQRTKTIRRRPVAGAEEIPMDVFRYTDHYEANKVPIIANTYALQDETVEAAPNRFTFPEELTCQSVSRQRGAENDRESESEYSLEESEEEETSYKEVNVPISMCFTLVIGYIGIGAKLFRDLEDWSWNESIYFCFVTLTTIGFGDYVPGEKITSQQQTLTLAILALYLVIGMALLAMSLNLVRDAVANKVRDIGKNIGIISDNDDSDSL